VGSGDLVILKDRHPAEALHVEAPGTNKVAKCTAR
jgi:hypothetical protein